MTKENGDHFLQKSKIQSRITSCQDPELEYSPIDEGKAESIERQIARSVESELQVWRENEVGKTCMEHAF